jgi:hypothetical protein
MNRRWPRRCSTAARDGIDLVPLLRKRHADLDSLGMRQPMTGPQQSGLSYNDFAR